ncbi:MAG: LysE/ArgO family amino acid transporter [Rhizobiaceae bacterium]
MIIPFLNGFALGASLIIAIGAQNAFILKQGLLREHVFILCLICACADALLIAAGVGGLGTLVASNPALVKAVTLLGAVFLGVYALFAFQRAFRDQSMRVSNESSSLRAAIAACLAFTFLNPHVYLDTVLLLGGLSARYAGEARLAYGAGAMLASFVWFFALGYGARLLLPMFQKPAAWRTLDILIGIVMSLIAASLAVQFLRS